MTTPAPYDLCFVGFGHVAQRFVALVDEQRRRLAREHGVRFRFVGAVTRHRQVEEPRGVSARELVRRMASQRGEPSTAATTRAVVDFVRRTVRASASARAGRLIVVETTTLDVTAGEPATTYILAALRGGAHVVTANKGPVACAYARIARAARTAGRRFLFEAAVMDGIPVFNLVRSSLPAVRIIGFRGVVNSTTNFILTAMERGEPFDAALRAMQRDGIAEADPSLDVDGWDAAAKTAALANVLMGATLTPARVDRRGIGPSTAAEIEAARKAGRRMKLVASARVGPGGVDARVAPTAVVSSDLLASLQGQQNAVILDTDLLGEIAVVQLGAGLTQTAYGLLSDSLTISRDAGRSPRSGRPGRSL